MCTSVRHQLEVEKAGVVAAVLSVAGVVVETLGLPLLDQTLGLGTLFAATLAGARENDLVEFDPAVVEEMGAARVVKQVEELEEMCRGEKREEI